MKKYDLRRLIAAGLSMVLLSGCGGTAAPKDNNDGKKVSLYDRGLSLIAKMDLMAESEGYVGMMTSSPDVTEVLKEIGDKDYTTPKAVYQVTFTEGAFENLFDVYGGQLDSVPEEVLGDLKHRMATSIPTMLSAMEGSNVLAAVSLIMANDYFIDESLTEDTIYFYIYDSRCCGAVVFSVHDDGIVSAEGRMMVSEVLSQTSGEEDMKEWLMENAGLLGVEISQVSP